MKRQWRKKARQTAVVMGIAILASNFSVFGAQSDDLLKEIQSITGAESMKDGVPKKPNYTVTVEKSDSTVNTFSSEQIVGEENVIRVRRNGEDENEEAVGPGRTQTTLASDEIRPETEVGPKVQEVRLSETYHDEFQIYTESIEGRFFIYSNIGNNGMTNLPVSLDIPHNVSYTVEKDGAPFTYYSKQILTETGTYVFYFTAVKDESQPLSKQVIYETTFNFRIQPKPPAAESDAVPASGNAQNGSYGSASSGDFQTNLENMQVSQETTAAEAIDFMETEPATEVIEETEAAETVEETADSEAYEETMEAEETEASEENAEDAETIPAEKRKSIGYKQTYDAERMMYRIAFSETSYFDSNVPNGMLSNVGVTLDTTHLGVNADKITVLKDGENSSLPDRNMFTEVGSYVLLIPQDRGQAVFSFYILGQAHADLEGYTLPEMMKVTFASLDGETIPVESVLQDGKSRLTWKKDGNYHLTMQNKEGVSTEVDVKIDRQAPEFSINLMEDRIGLIYDSSEIERIVVTKDGQSTAYSQINQIMEPGNYTIDMYDYAGNVSSKSVVLPKKVNMAGVLAITMVVALIAAGVVFFVRTKKTFSVK